MDSLLPISNALVDGADMLSPAAPGIDGSAASVLAVPVVAMGTGGLVTGPVSPSISGATAPVLGVPVVAMAGGRISGPVIPGGGGGGRGGFPGWSLDVIAFDVLVLQPLLNRKNAG
jgi:hypothetical protein